MAGDENRQLVPRFEDRASSRRNRLAVAFDHGDEGLAWEAELANGRAVDRMIDGNGELHEIELAQGLGVGLRNE